LPSVKNQRVIDFMQGCEVLPGLWTQFSDGNDFAVVGRPESIFGIGLRSII
jgi:hypothetical protein